MGCALFHPEGPMGKLMLNKGSGISYSGEN